MTQIFNYEDFHRLIEDFATEIPQLLKENNLTANLSKQLENLLDVTNNPFTLAVVGQMRSGKSTLLNSLIGKDLAVTGVNETTATINWFKYAPKEECNKFRVIWKNKAAENFRIGQIDEWIGNSEKAANARYLEFYTDSEYLKEANVVDTPGTRSVIESHEEAINNFLSNRHSGETLKEGENADAILYVVMPVARQTDSDMLSDFDKNTRIPGSSPYNSIAVVHKWEMLEANDPFDEVQKKVLIIKETMKDKVAVVLPYSAPMAIAVTRFDEGFWGNLSKLISGTKSDILEDLIEAENYFFDEEECSLTIEERKALRANYDIPWRTFHTIIKTAMNKKIAKAKNIKEYVRLMSGVDNLKRELKKRFFSRSKMIKMFSIMSKAWEPCQIAQLRLRNNKILLNENVQNVEKIVGILKNRIESGDTSLNLVLDYVINSKNSMKNSLQRNAIALRKIGAAAMKIKDVFDDMNNDIKMIDILEETQTGMDPNLLNKLRYILGYYGADINSRLKLLSTTNEIPNIDLIEEELDELNEMKFKYKGNLGKVIKHTISRLEQIADWIEENN